MKGFLVQVTKRKAAQICADDFNEIIDLYVKGDVAAPEAVILASNVLSCYFRNDHFQNPMFRIEDFKDALKVSLSKQYPTLNSHFFRGCLIEGLIKFGVEPKKAKDFISDYLNISHGTANTSHKIFHQNYYDEFTPKNQNKSDFIDSCCHWIVKFTKNKKIPAICKTVDENSLFLELLKECENALYEQNIQPIKAFIISPFEDIDRNIKTIEIAK